MAKVYISSTVDDLAGEREAAMKWLVDIGHQPVHSYVPDADPVVTSCLADVRSCDVYVLILGHRYGFQPPDDNPDRLSITHLEYRSAEGMPRIALLRTGAPRDRPTDPGDPDDLARVEAFREEVRKAVRPGEFSDAATFIAGLSTGLERALQQVAEKRGQWPQPIVEDLASRLDAEFEFHMRSGEEISGEQARSRFVSGVLRVRRQQDGGEQTLDGILATAGSQLLVVGEGGSGKTTMLKQLAAAGAGRASQEPRAPICIYLRLASFDRTDGGLDLLIDRLSIAARLERHDFERLWRQGPRPIVFLLDGLNEVALTCQPSCTQALRTLLQHSPAHHSYVVTSRPGSELEALCSRSTEDERLRQADIVKFGPRQVREYLKAQGLATLGSRLSGRLESLASNPFLLWAITRTVARSSERGPASRGALFTALLDRYIFEEREQSKPNPRPTAYNYALVKKPVLARLALKMTAAGVTEIANDQALWVPVSSHLEKLARAQRRVIPLAPEIFMPEDFTAVSLLNETIQNGVLLRDGNQLRFMHESVQEYFAAVALDKAGLDDVVGRAPALRLQRLDARGSIFELLVTWAGLSTPARVETAIERVRDRHPLLAAHMAVEAGLEEESKRLSRRFLLDTETEHTQRQKLGALGLASLGSRDRRVIERLVALLDLSEAREPAEEALRNLPPLDTIPVLVGHRVATNVQFAPSARLVRDLAASHGRPVADALLDAWKDESRRSRVAALCAFVDREDNSPRRENWRPIREVLVMMSAEAILAGNTSLSAEIDSLLQGAAAAPPRPSMEALFSLDGVDESLRERRRLKTVCKDADDATLERWAREGTPDERQLAVDTLLARGSLAALPHLVTRALSRPTPRAIDALTALPREPVLEHLQRESEAGAGQLQERARLLIGLLAERPSREALDRAFYGFDEDLRMFAAAAAVHAGETGVEFLSDQLDDEPSERVLEACVKALAGSGLTAALDRLLKLLFDPAARQGWPPRTEQLISDPDRRFHVVCDGWATLLDGALTDAGHSGALLERLESASQQAAIDDQLIHVARRHLPSPRAVDFLRNAMLEGDPAGRLIASWSLASIGELDAWRSLLSTDPGASPDVVGFIEDAARRMEAGGVDGAVKEAAIESGWKVLATGLADDDEGRRAAALDVTRRLPDSWLGRAWSTIALGAAWPMLQSPDTDRKLVAIRATRRLDPAWADRLVDILMSDRDRRVMDCAYDALGDEGFGRLMDRWAAAIDASDVSVAQRAAVVIRRVVLSDARQAVVLDLAVTLLEALDREGCVAVLASLASLYPDYVHQTAQGRWKVVAFRASEAFERLGIEDTWLQFAAHVRPENASHREFTRLMIEAGTGRDVSIMLIRRASEIWSHDLHLLAARIELEILLGNREEALTRLTWLEEQFDERIDHAWIGEQFGKLGLLDDALRHCRVAVERGPARAEAHFQAGWFAFLTGDFRGSVPSTKRGLELEPANAAAEFNLGLALLALDEIDGAETAYRRGIALAGRQAPADARRDVVAALADFAHLTRLSDAASAALERVRALVQSEVSRLGESAVT